MGRRGNYYVVEGGDSWERIAKYVYGNARMFGDLMRANGNIRGGLRPGMVLRLPSERKGVSPFVSSAQAAGQGMATYEQYQAGYNPATNRYEGAYGQPGGAAAKPATAGVNQAGILNQDWVNGPPQAAPLYTTPLPGAVASEQGKFGGTGSATTPTTTPAGSTYKPPANVAAAARPGKTPNQPTQTLAAQLGLLPGGPNPSSLPYSAAEAGPNPAAVIGGAISSGLKKLFPPEAFVSPGPSIYAPPGERTGGPVYATYEEYRQAKLQEQAQIDAQTRAQQGARVQAATPQQQANPATYDAYNRAAAAGAAWHGTSYGPPGPLAPDAVSPAAVDLRARLDQGDKQVYVRVADAKYAYGMTDEQIGAYMASLGYSLDSQNARFYYASSPYYSGDQQSAATDWISNLTPEQLAAMNTLPSGYEPYVVPVGGWGGAGGGHGGRRQALLDTFMLRVGGVP